MSEDITEPLLVYTLRAHRGEVACTDLSGSLLATGGGDGALRLWRWQRGLGWTEAQAVARAHRYGLTALRWAGSGALLASTGVDGAARVWSRTLSACRAFTAPGATAARSLCWGATRLLVGHDDGTLCVWEVQVGALMTRLLISDGSLHALTTLARGAMLLVACTSGNLKIFYLSDIYNCDNAGGELPPSVLREDGAHDLGALCAAASEGGELAASGGHDARVRLWCAEGRSARASPALCGHTAAVTALRWARGAGGHLLASASLDRTARLWAPLAGICLRVLHAHSRYLTCVALSFDLRFMITGSNDRSVRTWAIGDFTLDDDIEHPCSVVSHFGLGDLAGIDPISEDIQYNEDLNVSGICVKSEGFNGSERVWIWKDAQVGCINSIAVHEQLLAIACSDGSVRVFRWSEQLQMLSCERVLLAHRYPAMSVDIGASGTLLLSAGLDGRARLWDLQSGCELASMSGESVGGGEVGGGGVRGARVSPHRPPLLLLATDDGALALWSVAQRSSEPLHVYEPFAEAATCCAWTSDGRLCAAGGVGSELRLLTPPPMASVIHMQLATHDLGVLDCDFAPGEDEKETKSYILASAGRDALVKLWRILLEEETIGQARATMSLLWTVEAHGGAVESIRWGLRINGMAWFATSGADGWSRVWQLAGEGPPRMAAAVAAGEATGATAAALCGNRLLVTGSLVGELSLWRLPVVEPKLEEEEVEEGVEPRHWRISGVLRWLREYITRIPGSLISRELEATLMQRARDANITGQRLLDDSLDELLQLLQPQFSIPEESLNNSITVDRDENNKESNKEVEFKVKSCVEETYKLEENKLRRKLGEEIQWLRRDPPSFEIESSAPHSLRCPLTHVLMREPARAADGFTYERANILDYFFAVEGAVSPLSGRRLQSTGVAPNYGVLQQLRRYLATGAADQGQGG